MRKIIYTITIVLLLASLVLTACSQANVEQTPTEPSTSGTVPMDGVLEDNTLFDSQPTTAPTQPSSGATVPSEPTGAATQPTTIPTTQPTTPATQPTTAPTTPATQPSTQPTTPEEPMTYERFQAMSGAEQRAFQNSFENLDAFFEWYTAAKEAYEQANPPIEVGGNGNVNMGDILGNG